MKVIRFGAKRQKLVLYDILGYLYKILKVVVPIIIFTYSFRETIEIMRIWSERISSGPGVLEGVRYRDVHMGQMGN